MKFPTAKTNKTSYSLHYPHIYTAVEQRSWVDKFYNVASIDPALVNLALRIERRYHEGPVETIAMYKANIKEIIKDDEQEIVHHYKNATLFLDEHLHYLKTCHFIVVERQLPDNYNATRIGQHIISYLTIKLQDNPYYLPTIVELNPKVKGKIMKFPSALGKKQLKKWAVSIARQLLTQRGDVYGLQLMDEMGKKQDDLADTILQSHALFILWGLTEDNSGDFHYDYRD